MNTIDKKFIAFHQNNRHIYQDILRYTKQVWDSGHRNFGMKAIFERIRWDYTVYSTGIPFKLNNNYTSRYAKLVERDLPHTRGFFRNREIDPSSIFAIDYLHNPQRHLWP